jgi:hypothetical protein
LRQPDDAVPHHQHEERHHAQRGDHRQGRRHGGGDARVLAAQLAEQPFVQRVDADGDDQPEEDGHPDGLQPPPEEVGGQREDDEEGGAVESRAFD